MKIDIVLYPNNVLRKISKEVVISDNYRNIINKMLFVCTKTPNAIGLASPQIGINKRIIMYKDINNKIVFLINPEIIYISEDTTISHESCLSLPNIECDIKRSIFIKVKYKNTSFEDVYLDNLTETESIIIQHEIDHLNGILIIDKDIKNL